MKESDHAQDASPAPDEGQPRPDTEGPSLTKAEVAALFGVTPRTVNNWMDRGCPNERGPDGRCLFDATAVRAWRQDLKAEESASPGGPTDFASRANLVKADLVRKLTQARRQELELAAERGLKDLELADTIRGAKTHDDMLAISREVCALIGSGALNPTRARAIQQSLGDMRRHLKEHLDSGGAEDSERIVLLSDEGVRLVDDFEAIVSDERRGQILEHVSHERQVDEEEHPNLDLAALSPEEAEELGLDPDDLDTDPLGAEAP